MAIIYDNDNLAYSKTYSKVFAYKFQLLGGEVTDEASFSSADHPDFSPLLSKLQESKAEGLLIVASDIDTAFIAQKAKLMGWQIPMFTSAWAQTETLINNGGKALALMAVVGAGYLGKKSLENHQNQVAQTISRIVDYHLEHGERVLDSIARVAEISGTENLKIFMKSTWEAYGYFETIYCFDKDNKITLMEPSDTRYTGLDMSNLPDFKEKRKNINLIISRPFISLNTGYPTVYLIRHLSSGGAVIGELNLDLFQKEIMNIRDNNFVFIMDQTGMLIAHPSSDLVKQQTNMSNLGIFNTTLEGKSNAMYSYNGDKVISSAVRMEKTGWIVVDQVSLYVFFRSCAWSFVTALLVLLIIWLALVWNLRKQLHRYVITPLEELTKRTHMLTYGTYSELNILSSGPTSDCRYIGISSRRINEG
jgi:hypothetical protein